MRHATLQSFLDMIAENAKQANVKAAADKSPRRIRGPEIYEVEFFAVCDCGNVLGYRVKNAKTFSDPKCSECHPMPSVVKWKLNLEFTP